MSGSVIHAEHRFDRELKALKEESLRDLNFWLDEATPDCWRYWDQATVFEIAGRVDPREHLTASLTDPVYTYPEPGTVVTTIATDNWPLDPFQD